MGVNHNHGSGVLLCNVRGVEAKWWSQYENELMQSFVGENAKNLEGELSETSNFLLVEVMFVDERFNSVCKDGWHVVDRAMMNLMTA